MLLTSLNGKFKGYWYNEGYIRTSSIRFDINNLKNIYIHLTNDAIQNKGRSYGRHEIGNKLSF